MWPPETPARKWVFMPSPCDCEGGGRGQARYQMCSWISLGRRGKGWKIVGSGMIVVDVDVDGVDFGS